MTQPDRDDDREERIEMEIVVDCYGGAEQAAGWHEYLASTLAFPFQARCALEMRASPLRLGEEITVTGMDPDSEYDMRVMTEWAGRTFSVPLAQLEADADEDTETAVADWRYWTGRGYTFF